MPLDLIEFVTLHTYGQRCEFIPNYDRGTPAIRWVRACAVPKGEELDYAAYRAALANGAVQI